jgi:hypothetical protein
LSRDACCRDGAGPNTNRASPRLNRPRTGRFRAAAAGLLAALASPAAADPVTLDGVTFSDEQGGVVIRGGHGAGTARDPFVLVEDITGDGPAVLTVRGLDARAVGSPGGQAVAGFALVKVVTNRTSSPWSVFELELREAMERPSSYEDGLSFAQAGGSDLRAFRADRFARVRRQDEPVDAVEFDDGLVRPGETVTVSLLLTDYTPRAEFFLLQRREGRVAGLDRSQARP